MLLTAFARWHRTARPPAGLVSPDLVKNLGDVASFPALSETVARAVALANDPNASLDQMAGLLRRDPVAAAAVLRRANSWAFRGRRPADDVGQAVVRIGLRECFQVVAAVGLRGLYAADADGRAAADLLLRHALLTACLASAVNRSLDLGFRGEEFTAGLLHDIGRLIVLVRAPAAFPHADPLSFEEGSGLLFREREALGVDHCWLGARFAEANRLPPAVAAAIRYHHAPEAEPKHRRLVAVVALADRLANHVQRKRQIAGYTFDGCPGFAVLAADWDGRRRAEVRASLPKAVVWSMRLTRGMLAFAA